MMVGKNGFVLPQAKLNATLVSWMPLYFITWHL